MSVEFLHQAVRRSDPSNAESQGRMLGGSLSGRRLTTSGRQKQPVSSAQGTSESHQWATRLHWATVVMALLASSIFLLTDADGGRSSTSLLCQMLFESALTVFLAWWFRKNVRLLHGSPIVIPLLLIVVLASLIREPVQRWLLLSGRPFEMMMMNSQKNLLLALAVVGTSAACQRLSLIIGVTLTIFCAAVSREYRVQCLIAVYGFSAISWLVCSYWESLQPRLLHGEQHRLPWRWLIIGPAIPLTLLLASSAGGDAFITSVRGFMPSSGGNGQSDPFSRGGVNDGDALVAGTDNIRSFGPIDDAPFAEDDKPSLYDAFDDTYDEVVRKVREQERAIALGPEMMAEIQTRMAKSEQAGREFSTLRKKAAVDLRRITDLESHALLYVAGRVPLHLRMEVYDLFDGVRWTPETLSDAQPGMGIVQTNGRPWLRVPCGGRGLEIHAGVDTHAIRIINFRSPVIPAPLDLRGIHIDKVDQSDMFAWHRDSIVKMNRKAVPELTSVHLLSECIDRSRLPGHPHLTFTTLSQSKRLQLPAFAEMDAVNRLAQKLTNGISDKYQKIEAICEHLRSEYTIDRSAHAPEDCSFPVGHFLFESRRGADYQFATAATLMLRSLGFSTRLVSGFYASPARYDRQKQHTAVHSSDVHFWCEVSLGAGAWATFDPSPGYEILEPEPGFLKRVGQAITGFLKWMLQRWPIVLATAFFTAYALVKRRHLVDWIVTTTWRLCPSRTTRGRILQTARLVESRLQKAGLARPCGVTLSRWIRHQSALRQLCPAVEQFTSLADWAAFSSSDQTELPVATTVETCCQRLRQDFTLKRVSHIRSQIELMSRSDTSISEPFPINL